MADSVGIDIVDRARIERLLKRFGERLPAKILGPDERRTFLGRTDRSTFLAGRFAGKEATIKALGRYLTRRPALPAIQIINDTSGRPQIRFRRDLARQLEGIDFQISVSHDGNYAAAVTVGTRKI